MPNLKFPDFSHEKELWDRGFEIVAGVDEAGRGALAGPIFAAAVIFPKQVKLGFKVNDSKKISPSKRKELFNLIKKKALSWSVGYSKVAYIEEFGITKASDHAMQKALEGLNLNPDYVLVDYFKLTFISDDKQLPLKFGDTLSNSIASASILAKVARDNLMVELSKSYPEYRFDSHKGYGTKYHWEMIVKHGSCKLHRDSFLSKIK